MAKVTTPSKRRLSTLKNPTINLLSTVHDPTTAQEIYSSKIQHHPLPLLPTAVSDSVLDARHRRRLVRDSKRIRRKAQKPRPLSARQKRILGVHDVIPSGGGPGSWEIYEPLQKLWQGYVKEILGLGDDKKWIGVEEAGAMLVGADLHGAVVRVVRSKCVSRVGVEGTVVREARGVLVLVSRAGEVKMIPKEGTVFEVRVEIDEDHELIFEIHGDGFVCRPAERAGKKFKARLNVDL